MKKAFTKAKNHKEKRETDDRVRHKVKVVQQNQEAKLIERALRRKDYKMLSEEY